MVGHLNRRLGCALALLLAATGCAPLVVDTNPDTFPVQSAAASGVRGQQSISLVNAYQAEQKVVIFPGGPTWVADMKQHTDTAITMLGRAMSGRGVKMGSPAEKTVTLRVTNVQAAPRGFVIGSSLVLEAEYGDGTKSQIQTQNSSPSDAWRAVNGALTFAVNRLLNDNQFLAYVNK
jgi:hypothetical protein